ncbi:MAG TPA: hypothetical protein VJ911_06805, partial [Cryomorphaceae bacterium]|nr:hypothetical protein [Cryomorphaceae bacterium]
KNIFVQKAECWFFALVVGAHIWPLLSVHFFPTLDGPAHVYNARILAEILFHSGSELESFYTLNLTAIPNLTGQLALAFLQVFLPGWLAEKVLQAIIIVAIPVGFRFLLNNAGVKSIIPVYLIFPFTYSFFFFYGFYNFCLSLAVLFFAVGFIEYYFQKSPKIWAPALVVILGLILYFSHLLTFAVFCVYATAKTLHTYRKQGVSVSERRYAFLLFCLTVIPGLILGAIFLLQQAYSAGELHYSTLGETANMYKVITPAKGILYGKEDKYTQWIFYCIVLMIILALIDWFRQNDSKRKIGNIFGFLFIGFFVLSFVTPNQGLLSGGILTSRIVLFALVFLLVSLAKFRIHPLVQVVVLIVASYVNVACLLIYTDAVQKEQVIIDEISLSAADMKKESVILPLTSTTFWIREHYSNYMGYEKPLIILENYEAELKYFPVNWTSHGLRVKRAAYADWEEFRLSGVLGRQPNNQTTHILLLSDTETPNDYQVSHPAIQVQRSDTASGVALYKWMQN